MRARIEYRKLLTGHADGICLDRLVHYAEILEKWSERHNLVRFGSRQELVQRHLLDALAGASILGCVGDLLDIGSGAGLPGLPLLIARPKWSGVLLEPRQKRWAFLRLVIRELGINAEAESFCYQDYLARRSWDLITVRAVGGYSGLLQWAKSKLVSNGEVVIWTTEEQELQLRELSDWHMLSSPLPGLDRGRLVRLKPCFT